MRKPKPGTKHMNLPTPNRRTVLKGIGAGLVGSAALSGTASAKPAATPPFWTPTWGSDESDDWEIVDAGRKTGEMTKPYTLIPMTGLSKSPHFVTAHDQVVDTPPQNKGTYNVNWHGHNVFYTGGGDHHNRPYNGKEVLTNSYEVVKDTFDLFLGKHGPGAIASPRLVEPTPNDAPAGNDDYLNTISQIENASHARSEGDPANVPEKSGSGDVLFPTDDPALQDGTTYGEIFGAGFFVAFKFVCPVRPTESQDD